MHMYVSWSGVKGICMQAILMHGAYNFKKLVFKKSTSVVLWKKMQVRGPKARYACVEKFKVIKDSP
jgi:hypothetical protein